MGKRLVTMLLMVVFSIGYSNILEAQEQIRMMSYNVLHLPSSNPGNREDTLRKILEYRPIDFLMVQELSNETGADRILNETFNYAGNDFGRGAFVSQQSNGGSDNLQQLVFYRKSKMELYSQSILITETRDINEYIFYMNDPDLSIHNDTIWLDVYVCHLKASQGFQNEQERLRNVNVLQDHLITRPQGRNVIFAGDFNVYTSNEPAYQRIVNPSQGIIFADPINVAGTWHNEESLSLTHTQATRENQLFGDGVGGGMDDRFDFIMVSENMLSVSNEISYQTGSYEAVGQSGNCFNENIIDCTGGGTTPTIRRALYHMSDHLPVYAEFNVTYPPVNGISDVTTGNIRLQSGNIVEHYLVLENLSERLESDIRIVNSIGELVMEQSIAANSISRIDINKLTSGMYFIVDVTSSQAVKFFKR